MCLLLEIRWDQLGLGGIEVFFFSFFFPRNTHTTFLKTSPPISSGSPHRRLQLLPASPLSAHSTIMFKLVTLLVLVIALIAGAFAQEERDGSGRHTSSGAAPAWCPSGAGWATG